SIGTLSYSPPEWNHFGWYYGKAATVWSLGIVLHQMVCGKHPFKGSLLQLTGGFWFLSPECQDVIRACLSMYDLDRPSLEDLLCDPWIQD
ncbi:PIM1 kinase, partial [Notiomystis cincta]|nr:PIM1 kinase [Notiomystis cincta]